MLSGMVRIRLLGPFDVQVDGRPVAMPDRMRSLLAALALSPGRAVSVDALARAIWGERLPNRVKGSVQTAMTRLRQVVGQDAVATTPGGYRLVAADTDVAVFHGLLADAGAAGDPATERGLLTDAVGLWRGEPLDGVGSAVLRAEHVPRLEERLLGAVERRVDLDLAAADGRPVCAELRELVARHPLREPLWERLIRALASAGRTAEALAAYADCRRLLADELGVEPNTCLRRLHLELLAEPDERPALPSGPVAAGRTLLPRGVEDFTGRAEEVDQLLAWVSTVGPTSTVTSIDGMPGVGKTTLAVEVAWRLRDRYPDGQLFADLRGHTTGHEPLDPRAAIGVLLRGLGIDHPRLPDNVDECAALWRGALENRRVLVVLDNAADAGQVRPLLPAGAGCHVLVTSRNRLLGLENVRSLSVDELSEPAALALFTQVVGADRYTGNERADVRETIRLCGGLPLAIRIAATRLRHRPAWTVAHLNALLEREQHATTDAHADLGVLAAFTVSYRHLSQPQRELFRLVGLHPGGPFDRHAAAALAGLDPDTAELLLEELVDVHLVKQPQAGRYQFHDLLRRYAHGRAVSELDETCRRAALRRLVDHYLYVADQAADQLDPSRIHLPVDVPNPPNRPSVPTSPEQAVAWLDAEAANAVAVTSLAAEQGWHHPAWQLPRSLWRYFLIRGHYDDWVATHQVALAAVERAHHPRGHIETLTNLAFAYWRSGQFDKALDHNDAALRIATRVGDPVGAAKTLNSLGTVYDWIGRSGPAIDHNLKALELYRELDDQWGVNRVLAGLGNVYRQVGRWGIARDHFRRALALSGPTEDHWGSCLAHTGLSLCTETGSEGVDHGHHALTLATAIGDHWIEGLAHAALSFCHTRLGAANQARVHAAVALDRAHRLGDRWLEGQATIALGAAARQQGDHDQAARHYEQALRVTTRIGALGLRATAHNELGDLHVAAGDTVRAADHHRQALILAEDIDNDLECRRATADLLGEHLSSRPRWGRDTATAAAREP